VHGKVKHAARHFLLCAATAAATLSPSALYSAAVAVVAI